MAYHFAELGANVAIAGRSAKEAEVLLKRLRSVSPNADAKFEFFYLDAQLNSNSIAFADQMRDKYEESGLYALAMSQDAIADGPRKETVEGHEWYTKQLLRDSDIQDWCSGCHFAIHYCGKVDRCPENWWGNHPIHQSRGKIQYIRCG